MAPTQDEISLRVLVLTLNLLNSARGKTRAELRELVPGYEDLSDETFARTFQRDVAALRKSGLVVSVDGPDGSDAAPPAHRASADLQAGALEGPGTGGQQGALPDTSSSLYYRGGAEPPRYRVAGSSFPREDVRLSARQVETMLRAAAAWQHLDRADRERISAKLAPFAAGGVPQADLSVEFNLEGSAHLSALWSALATRQAVAFGYLSTAGQTETRRVLPWRVDVRGRAVYLYGYDLDRAAPRTFRLTRFTGPLELTVAPGDAPSEPTAENSAEPFVAAPQFWLREDASPSIWRLHVHRTLGEPRQIGGASWQLCEGRRADSELWLRLAFENATDLVPVAPDWLVHRVRHALRAAAGTGPLDAHPAATVGPDPVADTEGGPAHAG